MHLRCPKNSTFLATTALLVCCCAIETNARTPATGGRLPPPAPGLGWWWALSSAAKVRPETAAPEASADTIELRAARNETEAVQFVLRASRPFGQLRIRCGDLTGPGDTVIPGDAIEVLRAGYVDIAEPTDKLGRAGGWPDPLLPVTGPVELAAGTNQAFWLRLHVPAGTPAGVYQGKLRLEAVGVEAQAPLHLTVYDFALPERMSCVTAFGFQPGEVFRYHKLKDQKHRRQVLEKYWANFAAHHISPYDPAPLDPIKVTWPDIKPPPSAWDDWTGLRIVANEVHGGKGALLVHDDKPDSNITAGYAPLIKIPQQGLRLRFWYRTAVPGHRFIVTLNHHDGEREWISGQNRDTSLKGDGRWQEYDQLITGFPEGAAFVRLHVRATLWTDSGENLGLVWFDDISLSDPGAGEEFIQGGDFELRPRTEPVAPLDSLAVKFDFSSWDRAMKRAIDGHHFNSFRLAIPGLGGGTFHQHYPPKLLGFGEDSPEYPVLMESYCRQMQDHLRDNGWLDEAYIYWFDEPSPDQYPFVTNGFAKLSRWCPDITRMLTEQVEPGLTGGPNLWCPISNAYNHDQAEARRQHGEDFWWYVCCGPKAPYTGLFIDHPAPELRIWLWQTFKRNISGILVWETSYWTSSSAYPDTPQDPYADPMSWRRGYGTAKGERKPWGNGDGRFIYPPPAAVNPANDKPVLDGPVDSIRWEHLRDGIEDYEYLCILRRLLAEQENRLDPNRHRELSQLLEVPASISRSMTEFAPDGRAIEQRRHQLARAIEELQ